MNPILHEFIVFFLQVVTLGLAIACVILIGLAIWNFYISPWLKKRKKHERVR